MEKLSTLGWTNRSDNFDLYYKKINVYRVYVSKPISSENWMVRLVECNEELNPEEIVLNYDADFDWVIRLTNILEEAKN